MTKVTKKGKLTPSIKNMMNRQDEALQRQTQIEADKVEIAKMQLKAQETNAKREVRNLSMSYAIGYHSNVEKQAVSSDEILSTAKKFQEYIIGE